MTIGGGFKAVRSVARYSAKIGPLNLWRTLRSRNACKACAFGTGGQNGGLYNEARHGIEVCNKNIQAHLSDIRPSIPAQKFLELSIAELAKLSGKELEDLGRLTMPLIKHKGDTHYRVTSYQEALETCVEKFKACKADRSFFYASGRSSNEAAFMLQLMARLYGTNNINNCSYYCHQASGVALGESIGTGTATIQYEDIDKSDLMFVFGANPASNHPRFVKTLIHLRRRGGKVIVVNPAKEAGMLKFASPSDWRSMVKGGEPIASVYVQPHLGGDIAFMQGLAKAVLELGAENVDFIHQYCDNADSFIEGVRALDWLGIENASGVNKQTIIEVAEIYVQSKNTIFSWSMGLTHHTHGVNNIQTLVSLALLRGMLGKPGAGLLPLRGHSNIQGTGSMGFTPALKKAVEENIESRLGEVLPKKHGLDTMSCMHASARGEMDAALMLGGNLLASNPDTQFATEALGKIPFKCYMNSTLNMSHVNGVDETVVVLPVRARDEEKQSTSQESMFNFVRLSDGGINRFEQLLSETEIISELASALVDKSVFDFALFSNHEKLREFIGDVVPGFGKLKALGASKEEFHIEGRTLHNPQFSTENKRARFFYHPIPQRSHVLESDQLMLTSVRSEGQFNSIIYHEYDTYRDQSERWILMMNAKDMQARGWREDQCVTVSTSTGEMKALKLKAFDIREGNVMCYYPEANVLISNQVDEKSRTPGFKSVPVKITLVES